jgi:hypothetical protein
MLERLETWKPRAAALPLSLDLYLSIIASSRRRGLRPFLVVLDPITAPEPQGEILGDLPTFSRAARSKPSRRYHVASASRLRRMSGPNWRTFRAISIQPMLSSARRRATMKFRLE